MPVKGENPITSYFPRAAHNPKLNTPTQNSTKRLRKIDEPDARRDNSRKRPKGRKTSNGDDSGVQVSPSISSYNNPPRPDNLTRKGTRTVIEIQDTPPSSPIKQASLRCTTPPSSPLPELTPSPEPLLSKQRSPSIHPHTEAASSDLATSPPAEYHGTEFEFVPSSQTQTLDTFWGGDAEQTSRTHKIPTETPNCGPSHNPDHARVASDDFVASSQSQFMEPEPQSPTDPDAELVPSSQTQEIDYFQASPSFAQRAMSVKANRQWTPSAYSLSQDQGGLLSQGRPLGSRCSQHGTPACEDPSNVLSATLDPGVSLDMSRPSSLSPWDVNHHHHPQSQESVKPWSDDLSSYGSLPDAVKEFQEMFNGAYESHPPT